MAQRSSNHTVDLRLEKIRETLAGEHGPRYWRCLEELTDEPGFREALEREFPQGASLWQGNRRSFLQLMGASIALAGLTACTRQPDEVIVPYVRQPEEIIPGQPLFYATSRPHGGFAMPVLARSDMGRPNKVEPNPQHPACGAGAGADVFSQASVLDLWDPDRARAIQYRGQIRNWEQFLTELRARPELQANRRGAGLRILTETVTSPTLAAQLRAVLAALPEARWHQWEPVHRDAAHVGAQMVFGRILQPQYRLDRADVIVSLDDDFLSSPGNPGFLRSAHDFAARRGHEAPTSGQMNRLYVVESTPTLAGAKADHRMAMKGSEVELFSHALARSLGSLPGGAPLAGTTPGDARLTAALLHDLQSHRGRSVVLAGPFQSPTVHALAHLMNATLGNAGQTVQYTAPIEAEPVNQTESLRALVTDMHAGRVTMLLILGGNPVYSAPADFDFPGGLAHVDFRVAHSLYDDETAVLCDWRIPAAHYLESWSDLRSFEGTVSTVQPLIQPLYGGLTDHELLAALTPTVEQSSHVILREHWQQRHPGPDFEEFWRLSLYNGFAANTAEPLVTATPRPPAQLPALKASQGLEVAIRPDSNLDDGRYANNAWLQELPRPLSKITWSNAALISPNLAGQLKVTSQSVVRLSSQGRSVEIPVWILPGHPDGSITVHLGYGRQRAGHTGNGFGSDVYPLRTAAQAWNAAVTVQPAGGEESLAATHTHFQMSGRELVRSATLREFQQNREFAHEAVQAPPPGLTLYPNYGYEGYAWGMQIDMNACIGCNACVIACQAENNIPVVGKAEVERGREMHWLRIDRYFEGDLHDPRTWFQPIPCMQCENAPCELVCPVAATVHDSEGINDMVYNRCVGTRYCSNNCPYKVRRFNFFYYAKYEPDSPLVALQNPDVSVRSRGVMEKCTYCIQRINRARIQAEKENRPIRDGEFTTACAQTCPTQAIVFGNLNEKNSQVARAKADPRTYGLLEELGTRPRTTYLAGIRNPSSEAEE